MFILATILDVIYQLIVHRGVYTLELLITAVILAIVPYVLVRGPINGIAKMTFVGRTAIGKRGARVHHFPYSVNFYKARDFARNHGSKP